MGNVVVEKSFEFGVLIVRLAREIRKDREYELAGQLLRSGTSVGANVAEAQKAQSGKDFVAKMNIALKEANETIYWLKLLMAADVIDENAGTPLLGKAQELDRILTSIIKTKQERL